MAVRSNRQYLNIHYLDVSTSCGRALTAPKFLKEIGHFFGPPLHKLTTEYDGVVALYLDCAAPFEVM
jgi:hypothetical protein